MKKKSEFLVHSLNNTPAGVVVTEIVSEIVDDKQRQRMVNRVNSLIEDFNEKLRFLNSANPSYYNPSFYRFAYLDTKKQIEYSKTLPVFIKTHLASHLSAVYKAELRKHKYTKRIQHENNRNSIKKW